MASVFEILMTISNFIWDNILLYTLIPLGIYFTVRTRFSQLRYFPAMLATVKKKNHDSEKNISPFQSLMISTASRVGTGNLAGVAAALSVGGPGAVFWMWLVALVGMSSSIIENSLALLYRQRRPASGAFYGGPAYYIKMGIAGKWGRLLAICFSISLILCFGLGFNAIQANNFSSALTNSFKLASSTWIGISLMVITLMVILGGGRRIIVVAEYMVPVMAALYLLIGLYVIITKIGDVPQVLQQIFTNAFGLQAMGGGLLGSAFQAALGQGVRRGLFSNEAGLGSSPNVAASSAVDHPVEQGIVQALGVFLDTIVICTISAMIILLSGAYTGPGERLGIVLMQDSLQLVFGGLGIHFITVIMFFFAFSSIIGNYYYCESNIALISGKYESQAMFFFRFVTAAVIYFGTAESYYIWDLGDLFMGLMSIINLFAILVLAPKAFALVKDFDQQRRQGKKPRYCNPDAELNWPSQ